MILRNERKKYPSNLTDKRLSIIEPLLPLLGNKSKWEKRELVNAVLYLVDRGCELRQLLHDFPPPTTVSNFYYAGVKSELWDKIRAALVEKSRLEARRNAEPS